MLIENKNWEEKIIEEDETNQSHYPSNIAIIGMAGRFPGAASVDDLWSNLLNNIETIKQFSPDEIDVAVDPELAELSNYIGAHGILEGLADFDARFFGMSPREAEITDPQHRLFLELSWEAIEHAGYDADRYDGLIGVYGGISFNHYYNQNVLNHPKKLQIFGNLATVLANEKDFVTTRVSQKLNLQGPSMCIGTGCSTSLVAVCQAFQALLNMQCDMALAGGVSMTFPQYAGYLHQEGAIGSSDGHCRPFDAKASGTVFSSGGAIVALKRLEDAIRDHDTIHAVIRGIGINNDGGRKMSFTAPSVSGQAEAIASAHACAAVSPRSIGYVEAHGTGTPLGDPVEIEALTKAFRLGTEEKNFCALGSIKSNIGHMDIAAGITGLIKTAQIVKTGIIPATLHYKTPNKHINFDETPFHVVNKKINWRNEAKPRLAGVSSFGIGGTNAHIIVENPPPMIEEKKRTDRQNVKPSNILLLSARSQEALDSATGRLNNHLGQTDQFFDDIAYTLQVGRKAFEYRRFVVGNKSTAQAHLQQLPNRKSATAHLNGNDHPIIFLFPGQGSQYVNMGRDLYHTQPIFRQWIDKSAECVQDIVEADLRTYLFPNDDDTEISAAALQSTNITQPTIYAISYALAKLWESFGIIPSGFVGHSLGEFVAATLAGVMSFEDAIRLMALRGQLMQNLPRGSMLSVRAHATEIEPILTAELSLAAINSPHLCIVAGPDEAIDVFSEKLENKNIANKRLRTSHAFHSSMMEPAVPQFVEMVKKVRLNAPHIPIFSTVTGQLLSETEAISTDYWAHHMRAPVKFHDAMEHAFAHEAAIYIEVGPRATLTTLSRQMPESKKAIAMVPSLGDVAKSDEDYECFLSALGHLWINGCSIDWSALHQSNQYRRIPLPTYPFERKKYWLNAAPHRARLINSDSAQYSSKEQGQLETKWPLSSHSIGSLNEGHHLVQPDNHKEAIKGNRKDHLMATISQIISELSGIDITTDVISQSFLQLGLDSLLLSQLGLTLKKEFNLNIPLQRLVDDLSSIQALTDYMDEILPANILSSSQEPKGQGQDKLSIQKEQYDEKSNIISSLKSRFKMTLNENKETSNNISSDVNLIEYVVNQQMAIMAEQLHLLRDHLGLSSEQEKSEALYSSNDDITENYNTDHVATSYKAANKNEELGHDNIQQQNEVVMEAIADIIPPGAGLVQFNTPPHPEARLGRDEKGNPAWFVPDPERVGKYRQLIS